MKTFACPTCKGPVQKGAPGLEKLFPFCSERCHLVDLGRWLGEEYRIPGDPAGAIGERSSDDDAQQ
ncbi:MAG TPA: DNA gyrase inhibitor YacG [Kofleriaceae bacterium]|nr:DNA gyrase inhibitor YacG [Kofleriaceae bacterium]